MLSEDDICGASHGERQMNFLENFAGNGGTPEQNRKRAECYDLSHDAATAEMLDEIHWMLRRLLGIERK